MYKSKPIDTQQPIQASYLGGPVIQPTPKQISAEKRFLPQRGENPDTHPRLASYVFDTAWHEALFSRYDVTLLPDIGRVEKQTILLHMLPRNTSRTGVTLYVPFGTEPDTNQPIATYWFELPISHYATMLSIYGWGDVQVMSVCVGSSGVTLLVAGAYGIPAKNYSYSPEASPLLPLLRSDWTPKVE